MSTSTNAEPPRFPCPDQENLSCTPADSRPTRTGTPAPYEPEAIPVDRVALEFVVPANYRHILDHELDVLLFSLEPVLAWVTRCGGSVTMKGSQR
ncbi:hypothetical protein [Nocardia sp. CA-290969]|uniref:hypothetical protein n=1 Tax=Nocardia sp. CA-290969 TaxID=3239986 RepID=UPI003D929F6E